MKKKTTVNPYEVSGVVDYGKLIREFGVKRLGEEELDKIASFTGGELHHYLRRGIVFSYKDLKPVLDSYAKGKKFFLYTGLGPSGPLHLGHVMGWLFVKWLQDKFKVDLWFQITDDEKFLYKDLSFEDVEHWTKENMLDIIALGFDPKKTHFLIDTVHAGIMYPEAIKVAKRITFSTIKAAFGFTDSNNIGSIFYTAMQTVPVFLPNILNKRNDYCLIPFGIDQDPHFRISRDVVEKLGHKKPGLLHWKFMPPLSGVLGKMSSSHTTPTILLSDSPSEVKKKINKYAFSGGKETVELHRKHGGNPDVDVAFQWLTYFLESDEQLEAIRQDYASGKLLSGELKKILIDQVNTFLKEHQERRKRADKLLKEFVYDPKKK